MNKPFATDLLITENTYKLIKDKVIVEQMPCVYVKGETDEIKMFALINLAGKGRSETTPVQQGFKKTIEFGDCYIPQSRWDENKGSYHELEIKT